MNDLIEFLRARLAEDEQRSDLAAKIMRLRPTTSPFGERLTANLAAKRAIIEMHEMVEEVFHKAPGCGPDLHYWACRICHVDVDCDGQRELSSCPEQGCETLRHLAQVYRDHLEWREEWAADVH